MCISRPVPTAHENITGTLYIIIIGKVNHKQRKAKQAMQSCKKGAGRIMKKLLISKL